jgi:two-component system, chemotaxis family, chemotaxis protein CheY
VVANSEVIKRLVVLIADSRSYSRTLLRTMLLQLGVKKVHDAGDTAAVIGAIGSFNPDILIIDWSLATLNSHETLRAVRNSWSNSGPDLPVIVLSNSGESTAVEKAIQLGVPDFMIWPISPKMLQQRLLGIVKKARKAAQTYKRDAQAQESVNDGL